MTTDSIEDVLRRPAKHWTVDGLSELLVGILNLWWGMAISAQQLWPSRLTTVLAAVVPGVTALALAIFYGSITKGLHLLKARWTYPRVGYVKLPGPSRARRVMAGLAGGAVAILVVIAVLPRYEIRLWMPLLTGATYAAGVALLWSRLRLTRLYAYAAASLASGALAQRLLSPDLGVGVVLFSVGAAFTVGGGIALSRMLRMPPVAEDRA